MSLSSLSPFPLPFHRPTPPLPSTSRRPPTVIRLSRWNNANAEPFLRRQRHQQEIEADLRRHRRFDSADRLASLPTSPSSPIPPFKSHGTPSSPSSPSIPGKASKYSKPPLKPRIPRQPYVNLKSADLSHPAFRPIQQKRPARRPVETIAADSESSPVVVGENGMSYRFEDMPFEFQYSYTETPKVKPLAFREPPYLPFGPSTTPRPWTGRAPLPASKKKLPEFDSFKPPPAGKKGVKPVQNPGPFLPGSGPRYGARTREEVLGELLTEEEVKGMVQAGMKTTRQLNMGRDGLTHNMLDNIHAHWKRRRVCKIKCKGVCTVDMDNVRQQLEEKTGGKVIYSKGGVIFLFRGRNYNYKSRPKFPLMLWKPAPPIYPRLVQRAPEGLTLEEATEMRKRGRELPPICKLGKNGVYLNLVQNVREAFEECELVRINCKGLHKSDCRKIGAKLKDLVPCTLISFEYEHILMWRGKDWKSSLPPTKDINTENRELGMSTTENLVGDDASVSSSNLDNDLLINQQELLDEGFSAEDSDDERNHQNLTASYGDFNYFDGENAINGIHQEPTDIIIEKIVVDETISSVEEGGSSSVPEYALVPEINIQALEDPVRSPEIAAINGFATVEDEVAGTPESEVSSAVRQRTYLDGVMDLLKQAIENGSAVILNDDSLDANIVYERAVDLAKRAPPAPVFTHTAKKIAAQKVVKPKKEKKSGHESVEFEIEKTDEMNYVAEKSANNMRKDSSKEAFSDVLAHGSLRVDELAKLLTS